MVVRQLLRAKSVEEKAEHLLMNLLEKAERTRRETRTRPRCLL